VLLGASTVQAKDLCIDTTEFGGNPEFILVKFQPPRKGKCRAFVGYQFADADGGTGAQDRTAVHGAACTPSSNDRVNFTLIAGEPGPPGAAGRIDLYVLVLSLPDLQGRWFRRNAGDTNGIGVTPPASNAR